MRLSYLLILLLVIPVVFAPCPPGDSGDSCDYTSQEDINKLEGQDLVTAINEGKITDLDLVDDNRLADAIRTDPSISNDLGNTDLARAVNQDLSLMDNPSVMDEFDSRAQSNTHILNNNPNIKERWFADNGITDDGAEIENYDGSIVSTKGSQATTFNINNHPGARVTKDGKLVLVDGTEIANADVTILEDGSLNIDAGNTDLSDSDSADVHVNAGTVQIDDKLYTTTDSSTINVAINNGITKITGENIIESQDGIVTAAFSGEISLFSDGHMAFAANTEYSQYSNGEKSKTVTVNGLTEFYTNAGCDETVSCIQYVDGNMRVIAKDDNNIDIKTFDDSIERLVVDGISDESTVVFNDNGNVEMTFSNNPVVVKGELTQLQTVVETDITVKEGVAIKQIYSSDGVEVIPINPDGADRFANSIYWKRVSEDGEFVDLTREEVIEQYGIDIVFGDDIEVSEEVRQAVISDIVNYYETFPSPDDKDVITIKIESNNARGSSYDIRDNSINLVLNEDGSLWAISDEIGSFGTIRHELAHLHEDLRYPSLSRANMASLGVEGRSYFESVILQTPFFQEWMNIQGIESTADLIANQNTLTTLKPSDNEEYGNVRVWSNEECNSQDPCHGYIRPYGTVLTEDYSTYVERITADPTFFMRNNLVGDNSDPRYRQKIDLLLEHNYITQYEYDAVFYPERYFTDEELQQLLANS